MEEGRGVGGGQLLARGADEKQPLPGPSEPSWIPILFIIESGIKGNLLFVVCDLESASNIPLLSVVCKYAAFTKAVVSQSVR